MVRNTKLASGINNMENFCGGRFDLPIKIRKIVQLYESSNFSGEKLSIRKNLYRLGYFLDNKAEIIWDVDNIPDFAAKYGGLEEVKS